MLWIGWERRGTGTRERLPSVDHTVRLTRVASSPDSSAMPGTGGSSGAQVCDPDDVSIPDAPGDVWVAPTWEQVVRDHSARVYRLAYRLSGNAQDAEDLTQETFVRVFRSLADFSPGTFEGWLHRITTNLFLDMVRRRQRIRFDALPEDTERLPGRAPSPEQVYADTHLDPQIQAALDALSPEFRVAVVLCDIEGLTYEA